MGYCKRCMRDEVEMHPVETHLCVDCVSAENTRLTYNRQHQGDWLAAAKEAGIPVWMQQPGETQWEYTVWSAYRDSYPGKKPSYAAVAQQLNTTYSAVKHISQRWSFQMRMQQWMKQCDEETMLQRRDEIIHMNAEHISMAQDLRSKLNVAISYIDPAALRPAEIATLAKVATDMERKAQIDTAAQEELRHALLVDNDNPDVKRVATQQSDLGEVVQILLKAGALGDVTQIGLRTTQELVIKGGDDDE